jgi:hypothetical protein
MPLFLALAVLGVFSSGRSAAFLPLVHYDLQTSQRPSATSIITTTTTTSSLYSSPPPRPPRRMLKKVWYSHTRIQTLSASPVRCCCCCCCPVHKKIIISHGPTGPILYYRDAEVPKIAKIPFLLQHNPLTGRNQNRVPWYRPNARRLERTIGSTRWNSNASRHNNRPFAIDRPWREKYPRKN